jgi:hypothetical protein
VIINIEKGKLLQAYKEAVDSKVKILFPVPGSVHAGEPYSNNGTFPWEKSHFIY